jgi:hypothetical protein
MSRIITVAGIDYHVKSWTGGDTPNVFLPLHSFMRLRGELYREQWRDYVAYWYQAPGPDVRNTFWHRASCDAWRTLTEHERKADDRLTLAEWAEGWPYTVSESKSEGLKWVPDSIIDESYRAKAWQLKDYRVSSVSGGSIWFVKR